MSGEEHKYFLTLFPLLREKMGEERVYQTIVQVQELIASTRKRSGLAAPNLTT